MTGCRLLCAAMVLVVMAAAAGGARADLYCKTVIGEVEGFGKSFSRSTAERSREEAIAEEKARRREMGREVVKIERQESACEAVYPLGFQEWYCRAEADVCVER
ncbi:MAG: hypothetical protein ACLFPA_08830 [Dichotomicrobium sp.]